MYWSCPSCPLLSVFLSFSCYLHVVTTDAHIFLCYSNIVISYACLLLTIVRQSWHPLYLRVSDILTNYLLTRFTTFKSLASVLFIRFSFHILYIFCVLCKENAFYSFHICFMLWLIQILSSAAVWTFLFSSLRVTCWTECKPLTREISLRREIKTLKFAL